MTTMYVVVESVFYVWTAVWHPMGLQVNDALQNVWFDSANNL
jgi:ABC-type thiamin/hydroxymethylpyrimidine transport system permease subunit